MSPSVKLCNGSLSCASRLIHFLFLYFVCSVKRFLFIRFIFNKYVARSAKKSFITHKRLCSNHVTDIVIVVDVVVGVRASKLKTSPFSICSSRFSLYLCRYHSHSRRCARRSKLLLLSRMLLNAAAADTLD